ncbi:myosin-9-like isoform X1 [Archocentrus centrarchus]|uniref:myosin-9-like isoform X1 n=1 Tax=Archocentrus centrarchus TaxID=63155 RepID=UPI0011E9B7C9|nr:myosin-9-like isoform X1 [Archocentrus centrarchus]
MASKPKTKAEKTTEELETELFRIKEQLKNEKDNREKRQAEYEKQLAAIWSAAAQEKAELKQSHQQELERVRSETREVTRDCDEIINNLKKKHGFLEELHQNQVQEMKEKCKDVDEIISDKNYMIESLENKLQDKEDIIKKQKAAQVSEFEESWDRNQKMKALLDSEVQKNKERKATIKKLETELKAEKAKNDTVSEEYCKVFYQWLDLNDKHTSLNETMNDQKRNNRMLEERLRLTELNPDRFKQDLALCTEDFEKAFPHASHNIDPAFQQFRRKFLAMKKKYLQGLPLSQCEKEAFEFEAECLAAKLKQRDQRIERLLKDLEKQKRDTAADGRSLTTAQTSEWLQSLLEEEGEQKQEIGRLKDQVKELQLELKRERRRQGETPTTSAPQPETAVPETGPGTVKRYQPLRVLPPIRRPPSS